MPESFTYVIILAHDLHRESLIFFGANVRSYSLFRLLSLSIIINHHHHYLEVYVENCEDAQRGNATRLMLHVQLAYVPPCLSVCLGSLNVPQAKLQMTL